MIFSITEHLSITLQGVHTTVHDCYSSVEVCVRTLERNHTDEKFQSFFDTVKSEAASKCDPPVLARRKRLPKRIDDGSPQHVFTTVEDMYRKEYFEALDCVKGELERRFQQDNFHFVRAIESILILSANGRTSSFSDRFQEVYIWQGY